MLISLEINDNKAKPFLEFLNSLDFVRVERSEADDDEYLQLLNERLEEYESNPQDSEPLKDVLAELREKYGF